MTEFNKDKLPEKDFVNQPKFIQDAPGKGHNGGPELEEEEIGKPLPNRPEDITSHMTRGGPGDDSRPGDVNTKAWWQDLSDKGKDNAMYKNSIVQMAKRKDIWFCTIPFTQIYSELDGKFKACCFGEPSNKHWVGNTTLKEWMEDSTYMNSIRKEMLDPNSDHKAVNVICKRCKSDEAKYGRSRRTNCLKIHTNSHEFWDAIEKNVQMYQKSGTWTFDERICEVQLKIFGSECNLDCYMCMHANSTTRQNVADKGVWNEKIFGMNDDNRKRQIDWIMKDKTKGQVEQIVELAPYIRSIKVIGGEPLIMKKHYEMLDALIETGHAKDIRIKYQTNLTKTAKGKHSIFKYIPKFQHVAMVASVDGVGPVIEYMRRRTDWNEVVENINLCKKFPNVVVDFNGLVSFLSVMRFYEVIDWCKENPVISQLNWAMVDTPKHFRPENLPEPLKKELIPKYKDWPDIVACLERPAEPDVDIQDIFDYLLKADEHYKGTKWEMNLFDVFPELEPYYDRNRKVDPVYQAKVFSEFDNEWDRLRQSNETFDEMK